MTFIPADDDPSAAEGAARDRELAAIRGLASAYARLRTEIGKVIIGQTEVVDQLLRHGFESRKHTTVIFQRFALSNPSSISRNKTGPACRIAIA